MTGSFNIIAVPLAIAALAAPAVGAASSSGKSNPTVRNDKAHFRTAQPGTANGSPAPVVVEVDGGFDWAAAGVGAAGGLGIVLVAGGAASALRRRPRADQARA
jgi:hypothetical protein